MNTQKETYLNPSAKYGIVLDTEGYSCQPSYNVGFTVVDLQKLQVVEFHSYAVPAYLEQNLTYNQEKNKVSHLNTMYVNNLHDILRGFNSKYDYKTDFIINSDNELSLVLKYTLISIFCFFKYFLKYGEDKIYAIYRMV